MTSRSRRFTIAARSALFVGIAGALSAHGAANQTLQRMGGRFEMQPETANPVIGEDGRIGVMVMLQGEPAALDYKRALTAAGGAGSVAAAAAGVASRHSVDQLKSRQEAFVQNVHAQHIAHDELFRAQRVANGVALRVAVPDIKKLAALPGVVGVKFLPFERLSNITSVPFINAPQVWSGTGALGLPADATGSGVRIGIIDTGIDYQHPDFGGSGLLTDYQKNANRTHVNPQFFPTAKVVGGMDFVGDQYNGANTPVPDPNPMDCNGHGTHVAGTAAGFGVKSDGTAYSSVYDPVPDYSGFSIGPGVAPGAQLYALRVFGCGGGTNVLTEAIEWAIDPNDDGDLSDHLDIINMSLGSPLGFPSDLDALAADNAAAAGVIVVAAAGNDGDAFFTNGSPAAGKHVVSAAAIVDSGPSGALLDETAPAVEGFPATASAFTNPDASSPPPVSGQSGDVVLVDDGVEAVSDGCTAIVTDLTGKIALIDRGSCAFVDKLINAQSNGAIGVIVVDNTDDAVAVTMGGTGAASITIPSISISKASGDVLKAQLAGSAVAVTLNSASAGDTFAPFSSRGPVGDFDGSITLKPDLAAPGLNIPSAQSGVTCLDTAASNGCITPAAGGFLPGGKSLVLSGTSMATPHVAGMMAVLRQIYPDATVDDIKAIAMNSAAHDVTIGANGSGPRFGARSVGSGRVDVALAATNAVTVTNNDVAGATSVTFDVEPTVNAATTHHVLVTNRSSVEQTVDLIFEDIDAAPGVQFTIDPSEITLAAGAGAIATITMTTHANQMKRRRDPTIAATSTLTSPDFSITLPRAYLNEQSSLLKVLENGAEIARLPVYAATRPHSSITGALSAPTSAAAQVIGLVLSGSGVCTGAITQTAQGPSCTASLASDELSLVSAFELQLSAPRDESLPGFASVHHVGVNYLPAANNGDLLLFGISTYGKWTSPSLVAYNVCIDTDGDGEYDKILYNTDFGALRPLAAGLPPTTSDAALSVMSDGIFAFTEFPLNLIDAHNADTATLSNNVMLMGVSAFDLGIDAPRKISYGIAVCPAFDPQCTRLSLPSTQCSAGDALASFNGPYTYDMAHPGIDGDGDVVLEQDLPGAKLLLSYNEANLVANGSLGLLLLHHHNVSDKTAEVIVLDGVFNGSFEAPAN